MTAMADDAKHTTPSLSEDALLPPGEKKFRSRKYQLVAFTALVAAVALLILDKIDGAQWVEISTLIIITYTAGNVSVKAIIAWLQRGKS